jgi:hypothetical protein
VPRDLIVNAEYDWIRFTRQLGDSDRTFLSLKVNVGNIDDLGFHVPYRIPFALDQGEYLPARGFKK